MSDIWFSDDGRQNGGPYHAFMAVLDSADMDVDWELTWATLCEIAAVYSNEHGWSEDELQFQLEDAVADTGFEMPQDYYFA